MVCRVKGNAFDLEDTRRETRKQISSMRLELNVRDSIELTLLEAREKHPTNSGIIGALRHSVSELFNELMSDDFPRDINICAHAVNIAAMAIRLAEEGDAILPDYDPIKHFPSMEAQ
jgi:hypothetical protein